MTATSPDIESSLMPFPDKKLAEKELEGIDQLIWKFGKFGDGKLIDEIVTELLIVKNNGDMNAYQALVREFYDAGKKNGLCINDMKKLIKNKDASRHPAKKHRPSIADYKVEEDGTYYISKEGNDPLWICPPIHVEAHLRDDNGENHSILLKMSDGEVDHYWALCRRDIPDYRGLQGRFLHYGLDLPFGASEQKHIQTFLAFSRPDKKLRCVDKAGWHGKHYVFPDGMVIGNGEDEESVYPLINTNIKGSKTRGTLKEWQDNVVTICVRNSRMILSLAAGLSGPCLQIVNEDSGGFNLKGLSSRGKSKCLQIAVSVCGSPDYRCTWRITVNALEATCSMCNDSFLPLDEIGQATAKSVSESAYMIAQGRGKDRMRGNITLRTASTWRVLVLSTGEEGIEEHIKRGGLEVKAGQIVRLVDIPAVVEGGFGCFEDIHGEKDGGCFADKIDEVCEKYYGNAIREFTKEIVKDVRYVRNHLKCTMDDFVATHAKDCSGQVIRVAKRFGFLLGTITLAIEFDILGTITDSDNIQEYIISKGEAAGAIVKCYEAWLEDRGTKQDIEPERILEHVIGNLKERADSRFLSTVPTQKDDFRTCQQIWGYKEGSTFYVSVEAFKSYFCVGASATDVAKMLYQAGHLQRDNEGKYTVSKRITTHSKDVDRFYVIDLEKNTNNNNNYYWDNESKEEETLPY